MGWKALIASSVLSTEHKKKLVVKMDDRKHSKFKDYEMQHKSSQRKPAVPYKDKKLCVTLSIPLW